MKNKGFVFVETIVVIVVLSLGLVMVYQSFANVLSNNKRRAAYNDIAYIYRTYYIEDFLTNLNLEDYIEYYLGPEVRDGSTYSHGGKKVQAFSCNNPILYNIDANVTNKDVELQYSEQKKYEFCEKMISTLKVKNIYITNYNVNDIKKCTTRGGKLSADKSCDMSLESNSIKFDALNQMSPSMIYYLRTLNGTEDNTYRLIVEYEEEVLDSDKTITKVKRNGVLKCPSAYSEVNVGGQSTCQKKVTKRYYSNVALVKKDSSSTLITKILGLGTDDLLSDSSDVYGEYKTSDNNLRYVGNNPKNYVYFNCSTTIADQMNDETCEKWRIVGVFNNVEDDKYDKDSRVKIIKDLSIGTYSWDTNPGFNQWGESTYVGGTQYEGSDLMRELNTDYLGNITVGIDAKWYAGTGSTRTASMPRSLINSTYEKMIQSVNWSVGATPAGTDTNVSLASIRVGSMYSNERSINYGYEYNGSGERKDTVNRTTTWIGKVGLPYVSDYAYSVKSEACLKDIGLSVYRSTSGACAGSWMNTDTSNKWTLSIFGSNVENSKVLSLGNRINADNSTSANSVYPTLYLKNDVRVIGGDGSAAYPYKLKR